LKSACQSVISFQEECQILSKLCAVEWLRQYLPPSGTDGIVLYPAMHSHSRCDVTPFVHSFWTMSICFHFCAAVVVAYKLCEGVTTGERVVDE
jgi:hypothetical protein